MKLLKLISCLLLSLITYYSEAQIRKDSVSAQIDRYAITNLETRQLFKRKGRFFFYWGYNRDAFTKSNIHFKGDGYDFTINNLTAKDQPEAVSNTYIKYNTFSVPQYNYRLGYFLNDKTFISVGEDHMKYSIDKQTTLMSGSITKDNNGGKNIGNYNNTEVLVGEGSENSGNRATIADSLKSGFVSSFEHCDGLNDVTIELGRIEQLWISKNGKHVLSALGAIGGGVVVPDSDVDVLGYAPKHDMETGKKSYHLAGYSGSALVGLEFTFFKNFFLQGRLKAGYINLPDILTTVEGGRASQHFSFLESMLVVGYSYKFGKK